MDESSGPSKISIWQKFSFCSLYPEAVKTKEDKGNNSFISAFKCVFCLFRSVSFIHPLKCLVLISFLLKENFVFVVDYHRKTLQTEHEESFLRS